MTAANQAFVFPTYASMTNAAVEQAPATKKARKPATKKAKQAVAKVESEAIAKMDAAQTIDEKHAIAQDALAQAETIIANAEPRDYAKEFAAALLTRNAVVKSGDTETAANNVLRDARAFNACFELPAFAGVFDTMLRNVSIADRNEDKARFVAVKTLVKIVSTARALGQKIGRELDGYTFTIGANLASLGALRIKSGLVSLSKSVEYDELEAQDALVRRMNCSVGTAGAQSGSTRMCLRELGIAVVVKGKRDDVMSLEPDNARANAFVALFA